MQPYAGADRNEDASPDGDERIRDFMARHGGPGTRQPRHETTTPNLRGWSEFYAADGYVLRAEWSRMGSLEEMSFSEVPPEAASRRESGGDHAH
jgi:hypothetical protein